MITGEETDEQITLYVALLLAYFIKIPVGVSHLFLLILYTECNSSTFWIRGQEQFITVFILQPEVIVISVFMIINRSLAAVTRSRSADREPTDKDIKCILSVMKSRLRLLRL
ncbi:hypothetical protein J6590_021032 [Homalodisca vitripennis]|nr:hypothetical protein J6590_021032 [Homalodisca vitripennis]